jgi:hypothetical protein
MECFLIHFPKSSVAHQVDFHVRGTFFPPIKILGAVPDNADMCYWIGDEEESIKQGEAG